MDWFILSIFTAVMVACRDLSVRRISKNLTALEIAGLELTYSLPFFGTALFYIPIPKLDQVFWYSFLLSFPLNWSSYLLYLTAITIAPISLTVPLLSFTPVFIIITGSLVLGERINFFGTAGILIIVCSSYLLHFDRRKVGLLAPIRAIFVERGSLLMFIVAIIFAFAGVVGKKAMLHSSPLFFVFTFFFCCNLTMLIGLCACGKLSRRILIKHYHLGLWLGILFFFHLMFHSLAIIQTNASYMIAIKRSSILFSVLFAWLIFKEKQFKSRGAAALLMFLGALVITLLG